MGIKEFTDERNWVENERCLLQSILVTCGVPQGAGPWGASPGHLHFLRRWNCRMNGRWNGRGNEVGIKSLNSFIAFTSPICFPAAWELGLGYWCGVKAVRGNCGRGTRSGTITVGSLLTAVINSSRSALMNVSPRLQWKLPKPLKSFSLATSRAWAHVVGHGRMSWRKFGSSGVTRQCLHWAQPAEVTGHR